MGTSFYKNSLNKYVDVSATNPLPVTMSGGGGGGDASAANQTTEITRLTSILAQLPGSTVNPTTGAGGQATYGTSVVQTGNLTAVGSVLNAFDAQNFQSISVQLAGTYVATLVFEVSNDGTNWISKALTSSVGAPTTTVTSVPVIAFGDIGARYFRVRATAYTSGTVVVTAVYDALSLTPAATTAVSITGTPGVNAFATAPVATGVAISPYTNYNLIALQAVKASAGRLLQYRVYNPTAAVAYVQVFNAATTAAVTLGTTVPLEVFPVPAGGVLDGDHDFSFNYSAGIVIAATTTPTGAVAVGTGLTVVLGYV